MSAPAPGSAADLLAELDGLGIHLEADGQRLRYRPRAKVTVDLAGRMKTHKAELLALLAKREAVSRRIAEQLAELVPYRTADGRRGWVHPRYRAELDRLGLL
jgi:hypothetical protein